MFSRLSVVSVLALCFLAAATPNPEKRWATSTIVPATSTTTITVTAPGSTTTATAGSCNTGPIQCCQSVQSASSPESISLLGLLGIVLTDVDVIVGLDCSPISVVGVGSGSACTASPVCCENNSVGSLISIGCIPIEL